jgi:hypothetical protein
MTSFDSINLPHYETPQGWKNLKENITRLYGWSTSANIKKLEHLELNKCKLNNDIVFLKRCRNLRIIPKGLRIKNNWDSIPNAVKLFKKLEYQMLKVLINENYKKLKDITENCTNLKTTIQNQVREESEQITNYIHIRRGRINTSTWTELCYSIRHT